MSEKGFICGDGEACKTPQLCGDHCTRMHGAPYVATHCHANDGKCPWQKQCPEGECKVTKALNGEEFETPAQTNLIDPPLPPYSHASPEQEAAMWAAGKRPPYRQWSDCPEEFRRNPEAPTVVSAAGAESQQIVADYQNVGAAWCPLYRQACAALHKDDDTCSDCPLMQHTPLPEAPSKHSQPPTLYVLPQDREGRKETLIYDGNLMYFPRAHAYVAKISKIGNDIYAPGEPLHWVKGKSQDHANCAARHLIESGGWDFTVTPPVRHSGYLAWRALALLETELEAEQRGVSVEELKRMYREGELT